MGGLGRARAHPISDTSALAAWRVFGFAQRFKVFFVENGDGVGLAGPPVGCCKVICVLRYFSL